MPLTTDVELCNLALARIGQSRIAALSGDLTEIETACALHYDLARRILLRRFIFPFSKKLTTLTASTSKTPDFGFGSAYAYPNDFIRLRTLGDYTIDDNTPANLYDLSEGYIFTDVSDGGDLLVAYTFDVVNVPAFDPLFAHCLRLQLAADISYLFTLKQSLKDGLRTELEDALVSAAAVAGQEKPPQRIERSRMRAVRRSGRSRDNTRV